MATRVMSTSGSLLYKSQGCQSVAGFEMRFSRQSRSYLGQYYAPSGLIVAASWTSFVIPPDSIPARVMLLITTFLILINVSNTAFANSPVSSSVNPIQVNGFDRISHSR